MTDHDAPEAGATPTTAGATVLTGAADPPPEPSDPMARTLIEEAAEHRRPVPEGGEHGAHPTEAQYIKIAAILAVITGSEVGVYYLKGGLADGFAPLLLALAAIKFFLVGAYFMHLKADTRVLRRLFTTGIVLAIIVYFVVFLLLGVFSGTHGAHA